jgi:hypothetical protein
MDMEIHYKESAKGIILEDNPLEFPPVEVVMKGKDAIKEYLSNTK